MKFPWERLPATVETSELPTVQSTESTVALIQADLRYLVAHTAVMVHSRHASLQMLVNTARGQIIPRGECRFTDGSTVEFQDIGMPQVNCPVMSVAELMTRVWDVARELGLELEK